MKKRKQSGVLKSILAVMLCMAQLAPVFAMAADGDTMSSVEFKNGKYESYGVTGTANVTG